MEWCGFVCPGVMWRHRVPGHGGFYTLSLNNRNQDRGNLHAGISMVINTTREAQRAEATNPSNVACSACVLQKHGLRVHLRNPHSFTPMLEEGTGSKAPRSLLLGTDMAENQRQIAQFSQKDAQVGKVTGG